MADKIKGHFEGIEVELIRGGGGNFIVKADGKELWHKRNMGDVFPEEDEIVSRIQGQK